MNVLILYGSTEGQTRKICRYLRDMAQERGHATEINDASLNPKTPESFDAVIVGASVHYGKYQSAIEHYIEAHADRLNAMPTAFLSVSMAIASTEDDSKKELEEITQKFFLKTGWKPSIVEQVAGALRYSQYNFFKKMIMRMIARKQGGNTDTSEDTEYTDWDQVAQIIPRLETIGKAATSHARKS